MNTVWSRV